MLKHFCTGVAVGVVLCGAFIAVRRRKAHQAVKPANKQTSVFEKFYDVWGETVSDEQRTAMMQALDKSRAQAYAVVRAAQLSSAARH